MAAKELDTRVDAMEKRVEDLQRERLPEVKVMRGELQKIPSLERSMHAMMEKLDRVLPRVDLFFRRLVQSDRARTVEDDRAARKRAEGDSSGVSSATREGEEVQRPWEPREEGYRDRASMEPVEERESNLRLEPQLRRVEPFFGMKQGGSARDHCRNFKLLAEPFKEVSELVTEKNDPKSLDAPQMFDEMELVQSVDVFLGFDAWKNTLSDGVDGSPSHDLSVIDKIECVGVILRRNGALAEFATVRHRLEVWEDRIDKMVPPVDFGDENFDEMVPPVDPGELLGRLKKNASSDDKSIKSFPENEGGFRAAGGGHVLSYDGGVDHLNRRLQFMLRKGSYQRMYFQQGTEAEESAEKCFMCQADDERVDATLYRSASLLSTVVAKKLLSVLVVGQWANTYIFHGEPKLKDSRELRTIWARSDGSERHSLRFKKLDAHILSRGNLASVLMEVCEECEELLSQAGRKYKSALAIDGTDVRALYTWGLALSFSAQLIVDMGLEAAFASKMYVAAIDKFDAMVSQDTVYAPDVLFRWGMALQPRSHLHAHNSKEKMKLQIDESSFGKEEASLCVNQVLMGHGLLNATSGFRNKCFGDNGGLVDFLVAVQVHSAGKLHDSWEVYNEDLLSRMLERNDVGGDVMFAGYVQKGMQDRAFRLFSDMIYTDVRRNGFTLTSPLSGCSAPCYAEIGDLFHGYVIGVGLDAAIWICNPMSTLPNEHGNTGNVRLVFEAMPGCDVFSWTTMVVAYTLNGNWCEARHIFISMPEKNRLSWNTRRVVIGALAEAHEAELALNMFHQMQELGYEVSVHLFTTLIRVFARDDRFDVALSLLDELKSNAFDADLVLYNVCIDCFGKVGNVDMAWKSFHEIKAQGLTPDDVSHTSMIGVLCRANILTEAVELFDQMELNKQVPCAYAYHTTIMGYGSADRFEYAYRLLGRLKEKSGKECNHAECQEVEIDDRLFEFAQFFCTQVGIDPDAHLDLHELGMVLPAEALEETVTSEDAQGQFGMAAAQFQVVAALAFFNWGVTSQGDPECALLSLKSILAFTPCGQGVFMGGSN